MEYQAAVLSLGGNSTISRQLFEGHHSLSFIGLFQDQGIQAKDFSLFSNSPNMVSARIFAWNFYHFSGFFYHEGIWPPRSWTSQHLLAGSRAACDIGFAS
jgi:hypothetical protein